MFPSIERATLVLAVSRQALQPPSLMLKMMLTVAFLSFFFLVLWCVLQHLGPSIRSVPLFMEACVGFTSFGCLSGCILNLGPFSLKWKKILFPGVSNAYAHDGLPVRLGVRILNRRGPDMTF